MNNQGIFPAKVEIVILKKEKLSNYNHCPSFMAIQSYRKGNPTWCNGWQTSLARTITTE